MLRVTAGPGWVATKASVCSSTLTAVAHLHIQRQHTHGTLGPLGVLRLSRAHHAAKNGGTSRGGPVPELELKHSGTYAAGLFQRQV